MAILPNRAPVPTTLSRLLEESTCCYGRNEGMKATEFSQPCKVIFSCPDKRFRRDVRRCFFSQSVGCQGRQSLNKRGVHIRDHRQTSANVLIANRASCICNKTRRLSPYSKHLLPTMMPHGCWRGAGINSRFLCLVFRH